MAEKTAACVKAINMRLQLKRAVCKVLGLTLLLRVRGAVTVSFSKYLPWQAMHFLQRSTDFSKTC
jgi:hypothetical protein